MLIIGAVVVAWKRLRHGADQGGHPASEVALSAMQMHLAFVSLFYGAAWDWIA